MVVVEVMVVMMRVMVVGVIVGSGVVVVRTTFSRGDTASDIFRCVLASL